MLLEMFGKVLLGRLYLYAADLPGWRYELAGVVAGELVRKFDRPVVIGPDDVTGEDAGFAAWDGRLIAAAKNTVIKVVYVLFIFMTFRLSCGFRISGFFCPVKFVRKGTPVCPVWVAYNTKGAFGTGYLNVVMLFNTA